MIGEHGAPEREILLIDPAYGPAVGRSDLVVLRLPREIRGHRGGVFVNGQGLDRSPLEHQHLVCRSLERIEQHPGALLDVSHRRDPVRVLGVRRDSTRPPLTGRAGLA
nr:hypothetical protein [Pseudomonas syringae group genomosp. 7]